MTSHWFVKIKDYGLINIFRKIVLIDEFWIQVATISANGDTEVGNLLSSAMEKVSLLVCFFWGTS